MALVPKLLARGRETDTDPPNNWSFYRKIYEASNKVIISSVVLRLGVNPHDNSIRRTIAMANNSVEVPGNRNARAMIFVEPLLANSTGGIAVYDTNVERENLPDLLRSFVRFSETTILNPGDRLMLYGAAEGAPGQKPTVQYAIFGAEDE